MNKLQPIVHKIGEEGNSVAVSHIKNDWYMLAVSDHYDENHIGLFLHQKEIKSLVNFLNQFINNRK